MTDARFPERWLNDRRIVRLSADGFRLFITALVWSVSNRTDGVIGDDELVLLPNVDPSCADELGKAGMWKRRKDTWLMVDFEATQTTSAQLVGLEHQRAHERDKKARQRAHNRGDHGLCRPDTCYALRDVRRDVPGDVAGDT